MNWSHWIRQTHRWVSIIFTVVVIALFIALGTGTEPPEWTYFLPVVPLFVLLPTGLYMFVLPYFAKRRSDPASADEE